jgi:glycosyltransferase involved in cell wall biosynthesis
VAAVEPDCEVSALTERYGTGLLTEPGDARGLADRIRELYDDRGLAARLGGNARATSQLFDRTGQVAKYMRVFGAARHRSAHAALHVRT